VGPRPAPGFAGLKAALNGANENLRRFVDRLQACLGALPELLAADAMPLSRVAMSHIEAAERLAATATQAGGEILWHDAAGEAAARFCHELIDAARDFPLMPGRHYPALFEALAAGAVVRPAFGRHPQAGDLGPTRGAFAAGRSARSRRIERGHLAGTGSARPVDVAADAARIRHRPAGTCGRHRRA